MIAFIFTAALLAHSQTVELVESSPAAAAPVLVFVHGGAWISGNINQYKDLAQKFSQQGFCVALAEYSLAPKAKFPQPIEDLEIALKKLGSKKTKCDLNKIYLLGHSAGAHTIAMWNARYTNGKVKGFIGVEGIYDLPALVKRWPAYREQFITAEFGRDAGKWAAASPLQASMKSQAPWLLVHSHRDELVDEDQTFNFMKHLEQLKIHTQMLQFVKESHFGVLQSLGEKASPGNKILLKFLDQKK